MITSLYAGLLGLYFIALSIYVIRGRQHFKVALLDGSIDELRKRIRAHGNFSEYTPFFLILLAIAEHNGLAAYGIHGLGCLFIFGRVMHSYSLIKVEKYQEKLLTSHIRFRAAGMVGTFISLGALSIILVAQFLIQ